MKKLIAVALILGLFVGVSGAYTLQLDKLTIGSFYDFKSDKLLVGGFTSVFDYAKVISADIGLVTDLDSVAVMSGLSIDILNAVNKAANKFGIPLNYNLPEKLNVGMFGARDFSAKKWLWGIFAGIRF